MSKNIIIAIDGPAGSGKSSVTQAIAKRFGLLHVDTGAMYRAVAYLALQDGIFIHQPDFEEKVTMIARHLDIVLEDEKVFVHGHNFTMHIRSPQVSQVVSDVAAVEGVRLALVVLQRTIGSSRPAIVEGRDIGTVVFPDADLKIYLSASLEARSVRRAEQLRNEALESAPSLESVQQGIVQRDSKDSKRSMAPLMKALDAVEIDSTYLHFDEVVDIISILIHKRLPELQSLPLENFENMRLKNRSRAP